MVLAPLVPALASTFTPDYDCAVPFIAQGSTSTVTDTGVTVTATTNSAVRGDRVNTYLYQSYTRIKTVLTFDPPIPAIRLVTRNHADAPDFETFTFTGLSGPSGTGSTFSPTPITNQDTVITYESGTAGGFTGVMSQLTIDYTFGGTDPPFPPLARGSYLDIVLSCVDLTPTSQSVTGQAGTALTTSTFSLTGFLGTPTYALASGTLPAGLTLNTTTGVISGTPTAASSASVTVRATGASFGTDTATVAFNIAADPNPPAPPAPQPDPPAPERAPTPTPTPSPTPSAAPPNLDPITGVVNPNVPIGGVPLGGSVLLVDGQPGSVTVRPDAPVNPTGLEVEGPGFTMRLVGRSTNDRPLGLTPDGALILEQDRTAFTQGTGFQPNSQVYLYLLSTPRFLGTVATDANGNFSGSVPLPLDVSPGRHTLQANGLTPDSQVRSLSLGVQVNAAGVQREKTRATTTVYFSALSPRLDATAKRSLDSLIRGRTGVITRVAINGFVQASDTTANDKSLSLARAQAVARYLASQGIDSQIVARGRGVAEETGAAGRKAVVAISYRPQVG